MYDSEFNIKENKILTNNRVEPQHIQTTVKALIFCFSLRNYFHN